MAADFTVVFALYPRVTQLDFTGPYEVFWRLPGAQCVLASANGGKPMWRVRLDPPIWVFCLANANGSAPINLVSLVVTNARHRAPPIRPLGSESPFDK